MIECEDLSKKFSDFWAVDGVTLNVKSGEVLALLGQNGAGKTTTVRMLNAVLAPTRGWARIAGHDTVHEASKVRALVGVLTEQHGIYSRMNAYEYLDFFGKAYNIDTKSRKARAEYLLEYFSLTYAAKRRTGEYSKGMRQKLALARALLHEPPVLLLDEPTSAMDPESARLVRDHIADLRSSNRAIIICTHNLTEAESLADKIAIIYRGKIQVVGTVSELKQRIMGPLEFEVRCSETISLEKLLLPPEIKIIERFASGFRYRVDSPETTNPLLVRELAEKGVPVVSLQEVPRNLEQVYLRVMERVAEGATV